MRPIRKTMAALAVVFIFSLVSSAGADDDVLLQGFYWDAPQGWYGVIDGEIPELARAGFTAVWLPPPSKGTSGAASNGYDPYDHYDLGEFDQKGTVATRWGTKQDLLKLIRDMHSAKMKAIADLVMNHMTGADAQDKNFLGGLDWTKFNYDHPAPAGAPSWAQVESRLGRSIPHGADEPYLFKKTGQDFHPTAEHPDTDPPYHNAAFGQDLCQEHDWVNVGLKLWGDWLINSIGFDGFRIDFAKGLDEGFLGEWLHDGSKNGRFAVLEVWDSLDVIAHYVGETGASAFDFPLFFKLQDMCNDASGGFDMRSLDGAGFAAQDPMHAVTFAANHDTARSFPITGDKMMAYAYILTMEGYPSVFYSDYYSGLKSKIDPLIQIHKRLAGGTSTTLYKDEHLFIVQRNGRGGLPGLVLVLNNDPSGSRSAWVNVQAAWAGKDLRDYIGSDRQHAADDGRVSLSAPPRGYAVYSLAGAIAGY